MDKKIWTHCGKCNNEMEPRFRRYCKECIKIYSLNRKNKSTTEYHICFKCKCEMKNRYTRYCKQCLNKMVKDSKESKRIKHEKIFDVKSQIDVFVDRIVANNYNVDISEMLQIVDLYLMITHNENEYDALAPTKQINKMFNKLKKFRDNVYFKEK